MVKEHHYWTCNYCDNKYDTKEEAEKCEKKALKEIELPPAGIIFGDTRPGAFYEKIVFATVPHEHCVRSYRSHGYDISPLWATRDRGVGDSIGKEMCVGISGNPISNPEYYGHVDTSLPAFKRMVDFLKSVGIKPQLLHSDGTLEEIE